MKWMLLTVAVLFSGLVIARGGTPENVNNELAKLNGVWKMVVLQEDGNSPPDEVVKTMRLVLKDDHWTMLVGAKKVGAGTFSVDPARNIIERTDLEGNDKGKTFHGIYELNGDAFKTCWGPANQELRPTSYASKKGSHCELNVLQRVKE